MAETELSILHRQCLNRRIDEPEEVRHKVGPWEKDRNENAVSMDLHPRWSSKTEETLPVK